MAQLGGSLKVFFIGNEKALISNQHGMKVKVDTSINEVSKLDILVIPGGAAETFMVTQDTVVLNWIRKINETTVYTTSVCTGA